MVELSGKTAIISGGLGDIGQAILKLLSSAGANVAVGDIHSPERAAAIFESLEIDASLFRYDQVDVSDATAVERWVASVESDVATPQLVIPNAAVVTPIDILEITSVEWAREMQINLNGAFHVAQSAARRLVAAKLPGRIVFIGSWVASAPHANIPAYCVSKAGLRMLSQLFALRLAGHDILVNEVAPGLVDAGLSGRAFEQDSDLRVRAQSWVPVHKLIKPEEVAQQVLQLCDPANQHITGSTILMDGGLSMTRASHVS